MALAFALAPLASAQAFKCAEPKEETALRTRLLQTELMVAALTCDMKTQYNAFVAKFEPELVPQGLTLRSFFKRLYGSKGENELTSFVTAVANQRSAESLPLWRTYCREAHELFNQTLSLKAGTLTTFAAAQQFSEKHNFAVCQMTATLTGEE